MNKYNGYIALFVVFFAVFLGIRSPWRDHKPGPKRKARAVIAQTISKNVSFSFHKSCKNHDTTTPVATLPATIYEWNMPFIMMFLVPGHPTTTPQLYPSLRSSRSPPQIF